MQPVAWTPPRFGENWARQWSKTLQTRDDTWATEIGPFLSHGDADLVFEKIKDRLGFDQATIVVEDQISNRAVIRFGALRRDGAEWYQSALASDGFASTVVNRP